MSLVGVQSELSMLTSLDRNSLADRWVATFDCAAPRSCQATLLRQALGWHAQMAALRESVGAREADRAAQGLKRAASTSPASGLSPGTRLLREWQGVTHHVTVLASGFEYAGTSYRSLSAIARLITGSSWSGPLFFGLRT